MSNVIFTYNEESALSAGVGSFINETGAYVITITEAELKTSSTSKSQFIEFSGEASDGRKIQYLSICTAKSNGDPNTFGVNMLNAIMGCTGITQLTSYMKQAGVYIAPEFSGKCVGLVLQKELRSKPNGDDTYSMDIRIPFIADTRQTLQEYKEGLKPETVDKIIATLKDKDSRKKSAPSQQYDYGQYGYGDPL